MPSRQDIPLFDSCDFLDSKRIPIAAVDRRPGPYPYCGANGIQDFIDDFIFDDELVLLAEDGGNFGSKDKPIAYRISGKCWVNNHAHVLKPKHGIDADYLCYSLMFYPINNLVNGSTRLKLTQSAMRKIKIPIISYESQKQVVSKLKNIEHLIDIRQQQISKLEQLVKSQFIVLTSGRDVSKVKLSSVVERDICKIKTKFKPEDEIEYIDISSIDNVKHIISQTSTFLTKDAPSRAQQLVLNNDVLVSTVRPNLRNIAMSQKTSLNRVASSGFCVLRPKTIVPSFLFAIAMSDDFTNYLVRNTTGANYPAVSSKIILEYEIPLLPRHDQELFAQYCKQVDKSKFTIEQSLKKLETLKRSLMNKYFG